MHHESVAMIVIFVQTGKKEILSLELSVQKMFGAENKLRKINTRFQQSESDKPGEFFLYEIPSCVSTEVLAELEWREHEVRI